MEYILKWFDEWRMVRRVSILRKRCLWYSDLGQRSTNSPIKIQNGRLNEEGRRVLDHIMAEYLMRNAAENLSFNIYLEKAKALNDQLGFDGLKRLIGIIFFRPRERTFCDLGEGKKDAQIIGC